MRTLILIVLFLAFLPDAKSQDITNSYEYNKHGVVWSAGLFKSWLKDEYVGFYQIGNKISPVFSEEKKQGFAIQSHYMYKPAKWMGLGVHLGLGLDVYSYVEAPVLLFGMSVSFGNNHQFIIDLGWADGKKRIVPGNVRDELLNTTYTEIPVIYNHTELNTGYYLGLSYRIL